MDANDGLRLSLPYKNGPDTQNSTSFSDPWLDMAALTLPRNLRNVLDMCEGIWLKNGTYRMAAGRITRYFITKLDYEGVDENQRKKLNDFMNNKFKVTEMLSLIGDDFLCFHGDTPVVTREGIYAIKTLEGKTIDVLSKGGVYRSAEFKSFGTQELLEVTFSDDRRVLATPEHQWHVLKSTGGTTIVPTTELEGRRIPRTVAPRPPKNDEYNEGVRHGFVFGDGSIYNKTRKTPMGVANFFGEKDMAVMPYFSNCGSQPKEYPKYKLRKVHGLPAYYKQLPANTASASYWYGFVCGFLAADGSVDVYGCPLLTQKSRATLECIAAQLPRISMSAGPIREYTHDANFTREDGTTYSCGERSYCVMSLHKQFMRVDDLIIKAHIAKFKACDVATNYGKFIGVKSVKSTGIVDKVYCCVEPITHTFVVGNGILTGNCYGNSFSSIVAPFRRFLICSDCHTEQPILQARWKFADFKFQAYCPKCEAWVVHKHLDRRSTEEDKFWVKRWAPQQFRLLCHPYTNDFEYFWHIPPEIATEVNRGTPFYIQYMPWEMIEAVRKHQMFKFDPGVVYHMREQTLAGVETRGWGVSRLLSNFAQAWYTQVLKRYNEALALDYVVPFRVLTPAARSKEGDPLLNMNMQNFASRAIQMVRQHRQDPASWHVMPFPIEYQALGGEAKNLATPELLDQAMDEMLNAIGIPAQLYRGDLQLQVMPTALRLFQQTWPHLVSGMNGWLEWATSAVCSAMSWDKPDKVGLMPVTMADDLEARQVWMQMASSNLVSKRTAFQPWGIDAPAEQKKIMEEQRMFAEMQEEFQEDMQSKQMKKQYMAGQQGQQQPGGPTPMGGGVTPSMNTSSMMTPQDIMQQSQQAAETILGMPAEARRGELKKLKESNETMYALVKSRMADLRNEASSVGRQAVLSGQVQ